MKPIQQNTKKCVTLYRLFVTVLGAGRTANQLAKGIDPTKVIFPNQTCQGNKCIKFYRYKIWENYEFLVNQVTPNCCGYKTENVSLYTQVNLGNSGYEMAETTITPPQQDQPTDKGMPEIAGIDFTVSGFPKTDVSAPVQKPAKLQSISNESSNWTSPFLQIKYL